MKKIWLSTLLKFYAYVMVVILTIMGLVVAGISWKNQQAEADRIAQRVLTEVVTDLETSYQDRINGSHKKDVASLKTLQN